MILRSRAIVVFLLVFITIYPTCSQVRIDSVGYGWSRTSVNTVVFRKNSLTSHKDHQYTAYYDPDGFVVLGKRVANGKWELRKTAFKGNVRDAHNAISIAVDGDNFLHMAWDHHNAPLHYVRGKAPGSLELVEAPMTGINETR